MRASLNILCRDHLDLPVKSGMLGSLDRREIEEVLGSLVGLDLEEEG